MEALAARHVKRHGGELEQSLAALNAGRSTRESLARLADCDIEVLIAHFGATAIQQKRGFRPRRAVDSSIEPALEPVCKKAMALRPDDR